MLDTRKAFELYKLLDERQRESDAASQNYEILPMAFRDRRIASALDMSVSDFKALAAHVDALRKQAGATTDATEEEDESPTVKDQALARLMRGIKGSAHNKAIRWLGQKFLTFVWVKWNLAVGVEINSKYAYLVSWANHVETGNWGKPIA